MTMLQYAGYCGITFLFVLFSFRVYWFAVKRDIDPIKAIQPGIGKWLMSLTAKKSRINSIEANS